MKTICKKGMLIASVTIILVLAVVISVSAIADNGNAEDIIDNTKAKTVELWNRWATEDDILAEYEKLTGVDCLSEMPEKYAGIYFDDSGRAVINIKRNDSQLQIASAGVEQAMTVSDGMNSIVVRYVKYSQDELEKVRDAIMEFAPDVGEFRMKEMGISYKLNKIKIGVGTEVDIANFTEILLDKLSLAKSYVDMFEIYVRETSWISDEEDAVDNVSEAHDSETINAGAAKKINGCSQLYFIGDDGKKRSFSAATRYTSSEYGEGFISTGHSLFDVGDYIKCDGNTVGQVMEKHHDGYDDTSFIAFYNQYSWDGTITNKAEQFQRGNVPHEGATVKLRGFLANEYVEGQVSESDIDIFDSPDGIVWHDVMVIDHKVQDGDSGGACIYGTIDTGRTSLIVGVISLSDDLRTVVIKADNIQNY